MKQKLFLALAFLATTICFSQMGMDMDIGMDGPPGDVEQAKPTSLINGINYEINDEDSELKVIALETGKYSGNIEIPSSVEISNFGPPKDYTVTSIGENAFKDNFSLVSIIIPNSVTTIGDNAFSNCFTLEKVTVNWTENIVEINATVFANIGLSNIILFVPDNTKDSYNALAVWQDFSPVPIEVGGVNYVITDEVKREVKIVALDTANYTGVIEITSPVIINTIPYTVKSIGDGAFSDSTGLTSITLPNSITSVGFGAFSSSSLTNITLPNSVTSIASSAFFGCKELTSITLPNSITSIENSMFRGCSKLTSITIPNSVTSIGDNVFYQCTGLTNIILSNTLMTIGEYAFRECKSLTSITLPNTLTSIGENGFDSCEKLTSITLPNSITSLEKQTFVACRGLISITLPSTLTSIGEQVFATCPSLASITLPKSLTTIGNYAFTGCDSLTNITVNWTENIVVLDPDNGVFDEDSTFLDITLNVPNNTKTDYLKLDVWKKFNIIENITLSNATDNQIEGLVLNTNNGLVVSNLNNVNLTIYNMLGKQIANQNLNGVYIVKATNNNGNITTTKVLVE